jgi:hypothetical protein
MKKNRSQITKQRRKEGYTKRNSPENEVADCCAEIEDKSLVHQIGNESSSLGYLPLCSIFKDPLPSSPNYLSTEQLSGKKKTRTKKEKRR